MIPGLTPGFNKITIMIKLIYPVIVADSEALLTILRNQNIVVEGISTIESPDTPQTLVFVANGTPDATKLQIDNEMRTTPKKPVPVKPPNGAPRVEEEIVTDEARDITTPEEPES